jgi:uncharacterized repeat protein (TIGR02543 family)
MGQNGIYIYTNDYAMAPSSQSGYFYMPIKSTVSSVSFSNFIDSHTTQGYIPYNKSLSFNPALTPDACALYTLNKVYNQSATAVSYSVTYTVSPTTSAGYTSKASESVNSNGYISSNVQAVAYAGYTFSGWYKGSVCVSTDETLTPSEAGQITADASFTAKFTASSTGNLNGGFDGNYYQWNASGPYPISSGTGSCCSICPTYTQACMYLGAGVYYGDGPTGYSYTVSGVTSSKGLWVKKKAYISGFDSGTAPKVTTMTQESALFHTGQPSDLSQYFFLPAVGSEVTQGVSLVTQGWYWTNTANGSSDAYLLNFSSSGCMVVPGAKIGGRTLWKVE